MGAACCVMRDEGPFRNGVSAAGNDVLWVALVCSNFPLNQKFVCLLFFVKVTGLSEGFRN